MKIFIVFLISLFAFSSCMSPSSLLMEPPGVESNQDAFWETADIQGTGLSEEGILKHLKLCEETGADSQIIVHKGKIVSEWYSDDYREPVGAMSSTKVVASLLTGLLVDSGKLHYEDKVSSLLPAWTGGNRDDVRIVDLLTHSAGFERRSGKGDSIGFVDGSKTDFALSLYPENAPASRYSYSNEGVQLLEPIIRAASGENTAFFAREALFDKLGMNNSNLYDYGGSPWLYAELRTTPRDMARLGVLMANKGNWQGTQIVSEEYVKKATSPSPLNGRMGYLWWILDSDETVDGFYASGYLNTDIYVFPGYDVVIVRTQAPGNGYSGKQESGRYFEKAMPIFKEIVGER